MTSISLEPSKPVKLTEDDITVLIGALCSKAKTPAAKNNRGQAILDYFADNNIDITNPRIRREQTLKMLAVTHAHDDHQKEKLNDLYKSKTHYIENLDIHKLVLHIGKFGVETAPNNLAIFVERGYEATIMHGFGRDIMSDLNSSIGKNRQKNKYTPKKSKRDDCSYF